MTDLPTARIDLKKVLSASSPTVAMDDHSEGMSYLESVPRRLVTCRWRSSRSCAVPFS
jgi:multiple sugar transport system permease protein